MKTKKNQPRIANDMAKAKHKCHNKYPNKKTLKAIQDVENGIGLEPIEDMRAFIEKIKIAIKES